MKYSSLQEALSFTLWNARVWLRGHMNFRWLGWMKQRHLDALYVSFAQNLKDFEPISAVRPDATSNQLGTATSAAGNVVTNLLEDMVDFAQGSLIIESLTALNLETELRTSEQGYFILCADFSARHFRDSAMSLLNFYCKLWLTANLNFQLSWLQAANYFALDL